jgi:hypothetical protein
LCHFKFLTMINTTVGAGAASRYGSATLVLTPIVSVAKPEPYHFVGAKAVTRFGSGSNPMCNMDSLLKKCHKM